MTFCFSNGNIFNAFDYAISVGSFLIHLKSGINTALKTQNKNAENWSKWKCNNTLKYTVHILFCNWLSDIAYMKHIENYKTPMACYAEQSIRQFNSKNITLNKHHTENDSE